MSNEACNSRSRLDEDFDNPQNQNTRPFASLDFELYSSPSSSTTYSQPRRKSTTVLCLHEDDNKDQNVTHWFLFQSKGPISFHLSTQKPILIGSGSECDIRLLLQQHSVAATTDPVEKRHAVLAFEPSSNCFTVRDLNTTNGTYVNSRRLCGDHPETVSNLDVLRFGYDPTLYEIRSASLSRPAGNGAALRGGEGPSSLPPTLNTFSSKSGNSPFSARKSEQLLSRSISTEDNNCVGKGLPPKGTTVVASAGGTSAILKKGGGSQFFPRKSLLSKKNSDPGSGSESLNNIVGCGGLFSERLAQFQRRSSDASGLLNCAPASSQATDIKPEKQCDRFSLQNTSSSNVMLQGARSGTSGVCSPSLTLDSGRGSSSAPSSPAKEMSPVQMIAASSNAMSPTSVAGGGTGGSSSIGTSSSQSHNASPVFARKLSRPMEYLLGQQNNTSTSGVINTDTSSHDFSVDPDYSAGLPSGNYTSFCSGSEPISFATSGSASSANNANNHSASSKSLNLNCGFPSSDCEILQITEDFDEIVERKDSLEEDEQNVQIENVGDNNGDNCGQKQQQAVVQPQFLVGGDIMQPDLNVPNEVFGPLSHAEILNRNHGIVSNVATSVACKTKDNNPATLSSSDKGNNKKPVLVEGYNTNSNHHAQRARSSSGGDGGGGSNRSTPLSALYGTPHWWPDSPPPEENCCPPPPASSTNASPFRKPFLLNNNITNRLKENFSSPLADPVKDSSLESTYSQQSGSQNITPCSPAPPLGSFSSLDGNSTVKAPDMMSAEVKKPTPMAFTIDFNDGSDAVSGGAVSSEAVEAKKAAIAERLSKFAPRHRRNASLTKSDDAVVGTTEPFTASPLPKQTKCSSGSNSLGRTKQHQQRQSSVSTGGAESSSLSKSASLPKKISASCAGSASINKHPSGGSNNDSGLRSLSPDTISSTTSSSSRSRPLGDSTKSVPSSVKKTFPTGDISNSSAMGRKSGGGNSSKPNGSRGGTPLTRRLPSDSLRKGYQQEDKADNITHAKLNDLSKGPVTVGVKALSPSTPVDKEDTVSEAGTYTVEKEGPEAITARENIEQVFGLSGDEEMDKENNLESAARASSSDLNKSFVVGSAEPGTRDWVREWAELAAQQHQQKKHQRPEMPDSQYFLRETETLVSAIQERVSKHMKSGISPSPGAAGSDSDEDEPTLSHHTPVKSQSQHSTPTNTNKRRPPSRSSPFHRESSVLSDSGYAIGYQSDSSNEGSAPISSTHPQIRARGSDPLSQSHPHGIVTNKMNRAFNIRRGGRTFGYESTSSTEPLLLMNSQQSMTALPLNNARGISPKPAHQLNTLTKCNNVGANNSSASPHFARNDGGRFSLRMPKSRTPPAQMPPPAPRQNSYSLGGGSGEPHGRVMVNGHRSDSRENSVGSNGGSTSGKKFTMSGKVQNNGGGSKKSASGNRSNSTLTAKEVELANWKRRKNYDPMKAAAEGKKNKKNGVSSGTESGVEENVLLPTIPSPKVNRREAMLTKSLSFHQESYSPKCASEDEDMIYIVDETDSSPSNSPNHQGGGAIMTRSYQEDVMYYGMSGSAASMRPKSKLEALDNLVIATIHSLSNKVRTSSRHLLEKLQTQHANDENGALLEEMVSQLKELEGPSSISSPNKSPSRELSGTLKNLKKLEQVVLVLDKVLCDGFESDING